MNQIFSQDYYFKKRYFWRLNLILFGLAEILSFALTINIRGNEILFSDNSLVYLFSTLVIMLIQMGLLFFYGCNANERDLIIGDQGPQINYGRLALVFLPLFAGTFITYIFSYFINANEIELLRNLIPESKVLIEVDIWTFIKLFITTVIIAPVYEEIIYRGVILNYINKYFKVSYAVLLSSLIFGLHHESPFFPTIIGIVFALVYHYSGSIRIAILAHGVNNFAALISMTFVKNIKAEILFYLLISLGIIYTVYLGFMIFKVISDSIYKVSPVYRREYMINMNID